MHAPELPIKDATRAINLIAAAAAGECQIPSPRVAAAEALDASESGDAYVPELTGKIIVNFTHWRSERDRAHDDVILSSMREATPNWNWTKTGEGDGIEGPITIFTLSSK